MPVQRASCHFWRQLPDTSDDSCPPIKDCFPGLAPCPLQKMNLLSSIPCMEMNSELLTAGKRPAYSRRAVMPGMRTASGGKKLDTREYLTA